MRRVRVPIARKSRPRPSARPRAHRGSRRRTAFAPPFATQPSSVRSTRRRRRPARAAGRGAPAWPRRPARHRRATAAGRTARRLARAAARTSARRSRRPRSAIASAVDARRGGHLVVHRLLTRMRRERGSPGVSQPLRAAEREKSRVLSGAVVLDRRGRGAAFESSSVGRCVGEQSPHDRRAARRARDATRTRSRSLRRRDRASPHERQRLERLRRRAQERDQPGIAGAATIARRRRRRRACTRCRASTTSPRV